MPDNNTYVGTRWIGIVLPAAITTLSITNLSLVPFSSFFFIVLCIPILPMPRSFRHSVVAVDKHRCSIDCKVPFVPSCAMRSASFLFFGHELFLPRPIQLQLLEGLYAIQTDCSKIRREEIDNAMSENSKGKRN